MQISNEVLGYIVEQAKQGYPYEIGGILIEQSNGSPLLIPCKNAIDNVHEEALDYFMLDSVALAMAEQQGKILAIYHSHPMTPPNPSVADLKACINSDYPMVIVNPLTEVISYTTPEQAIALLEVNPQHNQILGRDFVWGIHDCYGLVRDVYKRHLDITLPDFNRGMLFAWDDNPEWDLFNKKFKEAGFVAYPVPRNNLKLIEPFDVALMNVGGRYTNPNHCGVLMVAQGTTRDLSLWHHLYDRKSSESIYRGYWVDCTSKLLRHSSRI